MARQAPTKAHRAFGEEGSAAGSPQRGQLMSRGTDDGFANGTAGGCCTNAAIGAGEGPRPYLHAPHFVLRESGSWSLGHCLVVSQKRRGPTSRSPCDRRVIDGAPGGV